jgi:hypothetical protein
MKKLILSILLLFLAFGTVHAATYTVVTAPSGKVESGATMVANGGTSIFYVADTSGTTITDLYPQLDRIYAYGFALSHVTPSQAQASTDWSGTTFSVYGKFKSEASDVPWAAIEPVYFFKEEAVSSSVSPQVRWINARPGDLARFYFVGEGGKAFGVAAGKLIASTIPVYGDETLVLLKEGTFSMPGGSGVSSFATASIGAWTSGTVAASFDVVSGASGFFTTNGDTPSQTVGIPILSPITYPGTNSTVLDANQARNSKWNAISATTIRYRLWSRKP